MAPVLWELWWKSVVITSHCEDNKFCKSYGNSSDWALSSWQINTIYSPEILQPTLRAQSTLSCAAVKQLWSKLFPRFLLDCCLVRSWLWRMRSFIGKIWLSASLLQPRWLQVAPGVRGHHWLSSSEVWLSLRLSHNTTQPGRSVTTEVQHYNNLMMIKYQLYHTHLHHHHLYHHPLN